MKMYVELRFYQPSKVVMRCFSYCVLFSVFDFRLESSGGALTNFEVVDLLRSRGAGRDPTRAIASVSPSEFKVGGLN